MKVSLTNVIAGVLLLCAGYSFREPGETVVITRVDTVPYASFRDSLRSERIVATGLRAKLAGRESRQPITILRTDTLVSPPDTVVQMVVWREGMLTLAPLIRDSTDPVLRLPEIHRFDVGSCDDGFSWNAGELVCDKARLGHLSLIAQGSLGSDLLTQPNAGLAWTVSAGAEWTPSNRSGWRASLLLDQGGRAELAVARRWRLF